MQNSDSKNKIIIGTIIGIVLIVFVYFFFLKSQVTNITLNTQYIRIYEGEKFQIEANISDLVWESTNPGIVMVNSSGVIEGINAGEAKIVVSTKDGKVSNSCFVVVVKKEIESFELDKKEIIIQLDEENEIKPIIIPDDLNKEIVIWESSNPTIASVNESGKVKGISNGIAVIKAKVLNKEASSIVYVGKKANSIKISKEKEELEIGKSAKLNIEVTPTDALSERIIWESSDTSVVGIDDEGNITAKGIGTVEITATTEYSKIKDTCYVTVSKSEYEVKYMELDKVVKIKEGDTLGTLPVATKSGYKLLGWYTSKDGGSKVSSTTIVSGNMTLYPHWEVEYCLPRDSRFTSYTTVAYSDTETFKYRIINYQNNDVVLVWVADAASQLKQALASSNAIGVASGDAILAQVPSYKSLVAVNASLFDEGVRSPLNGIILHDGKVIKNKGDNTGCMGITRDGNLYDCSRKPLDDLLKAGVLNNFTISHAIQANTNDGTKTTSYRTQICQVDKHNFALISSKSIRTSEAARILYNFSLKKCSVIYNLDGGGSRKLYYRTHGGSLIKRFSGTRAIPDMLYFTEK